MALNFHRTSFICANPRCNKRVSKIHLWFSPLVPLVLNGENYCSENCLRPQLQNILSDAVINRSLAFASAHRSTIGLVLLDYNIISLAQLNDVLMRQRMGDNRYLGEIIVSLGYATEQQVTLALSKQEGLPWVDLEQQAIDPSILSRIPRAVVFFSLIHPLDFDPILDELSIIAAAPLDRTSLEAIRQVNHFRINCFISPESKVRKLIRKNYGEVVPESLLQMKTILKPDDLYQFREELIREYKTTAATGMNVYACLHFIWIHFYSPKGTTDKFYSCQKPSDSNIYRPSLPKMA